MATYLIGYDLNKEGEQYSVANARLRREIKASFGTWWAHLDSTFIVKSDLSAVAIRDRLREVIDRDDELLVACLSGEAAWAGFGDRASTWLKTHI